MVKAERKIEDYIFFWIKLLSVRMMSGYAHKLKRFNVTPVESMVIQIVFEVGNCSPSDIAQVLGSNKSTIAVLTGKLLKKNILIISHRKHDRRCKDISLSKKGLSIARKVVAFQESEDKKVFYSLSKVEKDEILKSIKLSFNLLNEHLNGRD